MNVSRWLHKFRLHLPLPGSALASKCAVTMASGVPNSLLLLSPVNRAVQARLKLHLLGKLLPSPSQRDAQSVEFEERLHEFDDVRYLLRVSPERLSVSFALPVLGAHFTHQMLGQDSMQALSELYGGIATLAKQPEPGYQVRSRAAASHCMNHCNNTRVLRVGQCALCGSGADQWATPMCR